MTAPFVVERVGSHSPSSAGYRHNSGRAQMALKITRTDTTAQHWADVVEYLLGSTDVIGTNGGRITRVLPIACPDHPHMIADQIEEIVGVGRPIKTIANGLQGVSTLPATATYPQYIATVSFVPMSFNVVTDDQVQLLNSAAFDDDANPYTFKYYDEFNRYTDWWVEDGFEIIQAQYGSRYFVTGSGSPPDLTPFPGTIADRVPRPVVHFMWHRIPYRYVASRASWIRKYKGRINQNEWLSWKPGELLYLDAKVTRYRPGISTNYLDQGTQTFRTHLGALCDVEFLFELREWENADEPNVSNGSHITARGHNCERWFRQPGKAYYTVSVGDPKDDQEQWRPKYLSFPVERMFSDPDVASLT